MFRFVKHAGGSRGAEALAALVLSATVLLPGSAGAETSCAVTGMERLTLRQAVEFALCNQPQTRSAAAAVSLAKAAEATAQAALNPTISSTTTYGGSRTSSSETARTGQAQLKLSYVLFDFGLRRASADAAHASTVASELDARAEAQAVMLGAGERYFRVETAIRALQTADEARSAARLALETASGRYAAGDAVKVDVLQARSSVAEADVKLAQAQSELAVAQAALAQYMGAGALAKPVPAAEVSAEPESQDIAQLLTDARTARAEAQAASKRVESAKRDLEAASLGSRPTLSLSANSEAQRNDNLPATRSAAIGLTLDIPLFDGGVARSREAQGQARLAAAEASRDAQLQSIELSVVQAHAQLQAAQATQKAALAFVAAADEAQAQAAGRYRAGVGTLLDWLTLQSRLTAAKDQLLTAQVSVQSSRLGLARAVGSLSVASF